MIAMARNRDADVRKKLHFLEALLVKIGEELSAVDVGAEPERARTLLRIRRSLLDWINDLRIVS
jgi:hypothetical protein